MKSPDYEKAFRGLCRIFYRDPEGPEAEAAQVAIGLLSVRLRRAGWTEERIADVMLGALVDVRRAA